MNKIKMIKYMFGVIFLVIAGLFATGMLQPSAGLVVALYLIFAYQAFTLAPITKGEK